LIVSGTLRLKLETLQPTGSFKVRGAISAMVAVPEGSRVIAASAGNHALGIAWAAEQLGVPATVVIAETASAAKRARLEQQPVELLRVGQSIDEAEAFAWQQVQAATEPVQYVSPYNDPLVIAGQSTILDELVSQVPEGPLQVVVPLGGGGMLAGIALRASELRAAGREITVIGVEAQASQAVSAAVAAGGTIDVAIAPTIADGLAGNIESGSITVDLIRQHVDRLVTVEERHLRDTVRWLVQEHGLVVEGAGAAALAYLREHPLTSDGVTTIAILSGRNIMYQTLTEILNDTPGDDIATRNNAP
jgi:threonine dehydratase